MGIISSKATTESEERNQQVVLQDITSYLELHREIVYGISSSIDTTHENVKLVIKSIKEFVRSVEEKHEHVESFCKDVIKTAENLRGSIEKTLVCQSKALTLSYNSMNKFIHRVLDYYRPGDNQKYNKALISEPSNSGSSVDSDLQPDESTEWYDVKNDIEYGLSSFVDDEKGAEIPHLSAHYFGKIISNIKMSVILKERRENIYKRSMKEKRKNTKLFKTN